MAAGKSKVFLDSNVVLYLLSEDAVKADSAEALLQRRRLSAFRYSTRSPTSACAS